MSKKHAFGREATEKFISALRTDTPWKHDCAFMYIIHGKYGSVD